MAKQPSDRYADMEQLRQELEAVRTRLIDSGVGIVEPLGVAVDANAETVAGQDVPTPLRARTRRGYRHGTAAGLGYRQPRVHAWLTAGPVRTSAGCGRVSGGSQRAAGGGLHPLLAADAINGLDRTAAAGGRSDAACASTTDPASRRAPPSGLAQTSSSSSTLRATARRQLTAGRPQEALDTISAGLVLDASDAELRALVDDLARAARQSVNASRAATAKIGVTEASSADLRDARSARARSRRPRTIGQPGCGDPRALDGRRPV